MQAEVRNPRWRLTKKEILISQPVRIQHICTILTTEHIYSMHGSSAKLFSFFCEESWNLKSKMAAYAPKILTAQLVYNVAVKFQRLNMFPRFKIWLTLSSILCNARKHQKFKMAPYKPEILTSQPVYIVAIKFQQQYLCFQGQRTHWSYS